MDKQQAAQSAKQASRHPAVENLARAGYVMSGVLHLLIAWIVIRIATGSGGEEASNSGALAQIAQAPGGMFLLWAGAIAFFALALWQIIEAIVGDGEAKDKAAAVAKAVVYGALGSSTATFAAGGSKSDSEQTAGLTAGLMGSGFGRAALIVAGIVVLAVGLYHIYSGITKKFTEHLQSTGRRELSKAIVVTGVVGFVAKGIALAVLGGLIVAAVLNADPEQAAGLDAAFRTVGEQPFGQFLLFAVGVGIGLYGIYSFARAWYGRMRD